MKDSATNSEKLVSDKVQSEVFERLSEVVRNAINDRQVSRETSSEGQFNLLRGIVVEAIKPILEAWISEHLSSIIEEIVRSELQGLFKAK